MKTPRFYRPDIVLPITVGLGIILSIILDWL